MAAIAHGGSRQDGEPPSHDRRPRGRGAGLPAVQDLALDACALPDNTDATGTWAWCTAHARCSGRGRGDRLRALVLYERSMAIAQSPCRRRPGRRPSTDRSGQGAIRDGTILMKGRRHTEASTRFEDAFPSLLEPRGKRPQQHGLRVQMARASRKAGECCGAHATRSGHLARRHAGGHRRRIGIRGA